MNKAGCVALALACALGTPAMAQNDKLTPMENEGWQVAQALADKGVAAFVLKYRLNQTPADMAGFERSMAELFSGTAKRPPPPPDGAAAYAPQIADTRAAFALVRVRAGHGHHAARAGRQAGLHRQHLWTDHGGRGAGGRAATVHCPGGRRSVLRQ
jgi:hypothetical protein